MCRLIAGDIINERSASWKIIVTKFDEFLENRKSVKDFDDVSIKLSSIGKITSNHIMNEPSHPLSTIWFDDK